MTRIEEMEKMYRDGKKVVGSLELELIDKLLSIYKEIEPNQKVIFLDLVSSKTKDALKKLSFSSGL